MKRVRFIMRSLAVVSIVVGVVLVDIGSLQALVDDKASADTKSTQQQEKGPIPQDPKHLGVQDKNIPEFVPGELVVKLKEGYTLDDLRKLNDKFSITTTNKVFFDSVDPKQTLQELQDELAKLTPDHQSWYWQLDKNSKEFKDYTERLNKEKETLEAKIKAHEALIVKLELRQKRAPEDAITPSLNDIYLLKTQNEEANIPLIVAEYKTNPAVAYAEPNYKVKVQMLPNDPYYSSSNSWGQGYDDLWGLKKIQAEKAWDISQGEGVIVAVIDTGIDYTHEDITANMWVNTEEIPNNGIDDDKNGYVDDYYGYDFVNNDSNPTDGHGHGTHCAGTIAAVGNNSIGVIGVAPKAKVMAVKGLSDSGAGPITGLANCLIYAADRGADVLSNSWGGEGSSSLLENAVNYAYSKGCMVVVAAGNNNADTKNFTPANIGNVITVAASDQNDAKCYFSNYGAKIDISAPGGNGQNNPYNILSLLAPNSYLSTNNSSYIVGAKYMRIAGTSMACPHVAGLCALVVAKNPAVSNEEIRQILRTSADDVGDVGWDKYFGYGRVNAYKAILKNSVCTPKISTPSNNATVEGVISIRGTADGINFKSYTVEYGKGDTPSTWTVLSSGYTAVKNSILALDWDTSMINDTTYTIKLTVIDTTGTRYEDRVVLNIQNTYITTPKPRDFLSAQGNSIEIRGTAMAKDLINYKIEYFPTSDSGIGTGPATTAGISLANNGNLPVSKGLLATLNPSVITTAGIYTFKLSKITSGFTSIYMTAIYLDPLLKKSWPQKIPMWDAGGGWLLGFSTHTVADINGDGKSEIIIGYGEQIYVFTDEGKALSGWPQKIDSYIQVSPAVADLDGDGFMEIVNGLGGYVWKHDGTLVDGWPNKNLTGETSIADVNKDGKLDLVIAEDESQTMNVVDLHGKSLPGWPVKLGGSNQFCTKEPHIFIGDIDKDGKNEIVTLAYECGCFFGIIVLGADGTIKNSFPINDPSYYDLHMVLGDLDNDGNLEIVLVERAKNRISVFHHDGTLVDGWPIMFSNNNGSINPPSLADIDNDGRPEIIVGGQDSHANSVLYAWKNNGVTVSGWPVKISQRPAWINEWWSSYGCGSSAAGDINGDGKIEIIASDNSPYLNIIKSDGTPDHRYILRASFMGTNKANTPALADIDNDGKMEIIWVTYNWIDYSCDIFVWDLPTGYDSSKIEWGQFRHDARHTGIHGVDTVGPTGSIKINNDAAYANSTSVTLNLSVTDAGSGMGAGAKMHFSNDGRTYSNLQDYTSTASWTLSSGNGINTVYAQFKDVAGNWSGVAQNSIFLDGTPPNTPVVTDQGDRTTNGFQLAVSWSANDPESGIVEYQYMISRDVAQNPPANKIIRGWTSVGASSSVTASGLTLVNGANYYFAVKAKNGAGTWSGIGYSNGILVVTNAPTAPSNLTGNAHFKASVTLAWSQSSAVVYGFVIERRLYNAISLPFAEVARLSKDVTTYIDKNLTTSTSYQYRIKAYNEIGVSGVSNTVTVKTL